MEDNNLAKARSSIVWILALCVAFGAVWWIERESGKPLIAEGMVDRRAAGGAWARLAPRDPASGSVGDVAAMLDALVAARELGLVTPAEFESRLQRAQAALANAPRAAPGAPTDADLRRHAITLQRAALAAQSKTGSSR